MAKPTDKKINIGDVVRLNGCGQLMTVSKTGIDIRSGYEASVCIYQNEIDGRFYSEQFPNDCLTKTTYRSR